MIAAQGQASFQNTTLTLFVRSLEDFKAVSELSNSILSPFELGSSIPNRLYDRRERALCRANMRISISRNMAELQSQSQHTEYKE